MAANFSNSHASIAFQVEGKVKASEGIKEAPAGTKSMIITDRKIIYLITPINEFAGCTKGFFEIVNSDAATNSTFLLLNINYCNEYDE